MEKVRSLVIQPKVVGHDINIFFRDCHDHNFYEFTMVIAGKSIHHVNDEVQILSEGNLVFVRPADLHYFMPYSDNADKYEFFNIHVSTEDMRKEYEACEGLFDVVENGKVPPAIKLSGTDEAFLINKLRMMNDMIFGKKRDYLYYSLLKDVCFLFVNNKKEGVVKAPDWFKQLLEELDTKELSDFNYEKMLKKANVSQSYLWKTFKKYLDTTPTDYINNMKLEYAYDLIISTHMPLLDVCMVAGFNNYSYFHRLFLEKYKLTPNRVRERA